MKRKDFLKRIGLISAVAVTAPSLATALFNVEENILDKMISQVPKQLKEKEQLIFTVSNDIYNQYKHLFVNERYRGYKVETAKLAPKDNAVLTKGSLFF